MGISMLDFLINDSFSNGFRITFTWFVDDSLLKMSTHKI